MSVRRFLLLVVACLGLLGCLAALWSERVGVEGDTRWVFEGDTRWGPHTATSPDGETLASADYDSVSLWDAATGQAWGTLPGRREEAFQHLAFSPDGEKLAAGGWGGALVMWDLASGRRLPLERPRWLGDTSVDYPGYVAFSPDGGTLLAVVDERLGLWDVATGRHTGILGRGFPGVGFTEDGRLLAQASGPFGVWVREVPADRVRWLGVLGGLCAVALLCLAWAWWYSATRPAASSRSPSS